MFIFVFCCFLFALFQIIRSVYDLKMKLLFVFMASTGLVFGLITFFFLHYRGFGFLACDWRIVLIYLLNGLICLLKGFFVGKQENINRLLIRLTSLDSLGVIGILLMLIIFR